MKAESTGRTTEKGFSTLEILVSFAVIILCIGAVIMVVFGGQSIAVDTQTNNEAVTKAQALLEKARADSRSDFGSVVTTALASDDIYQKQTIVDPASVTQCSKDVISNVTWNTNGRALGVRLTTHLGDREYALALGGCDTNPPPLGGWNPPETWASSNFNPGNATGLDARNRIVYMAGNGNPGPAPNLYIADTNGVPQGTSSGLFVTFANGFQVGAKLNDIKVATLSDGKTYAFVARQATTNQLQMIDVTDIYNPISVGLFQLAGVDPLGSFPEAWRVYYFDNRVYVTTRYTAGPELHVFDVSNPASVSEIGSGTELGLTVNSIVVTQKNISGTLYKFAYMATSSDNKELYVLNVTNPLSITEISGATKNLGSPDYADGNAVFLVGNNLYFGRDSSTPDDLYIFDASNPLTAVGGLPIVRTADIGTSVIGIVVSGPYIFVATTKANAEFQVWTSDPNEPIVKVNTNPFNFPNITTLGNGLKYENGWIYLASQANDTLRILYDNQ